MALHIWTLYFRTLYYKTLYYKTLYYKTLESKYFTIYNSYSETRCVHLNFAHNQSHSLGRCTT
jgi:hypothetical protein